MKKQIQVTCGYTRSAVALMVLSALAGQQALAVTSANNAGPVIGRQIITTGVPTLAGTGVVGSATTAAVPGSSDADGDQLADWIYQWKADGTSLGAEAAAGSATAIPPYTVKAADRGKALTLCLKAVADKGFPLATKTSAEVCSADLAIPHQLSLSAYSQSGNENQVNTASLAVLVTNSNTAPDYEWSIDGGVDAARFTIDTASGVLTLPAQDFEAPADSDGDNYYEVNIKLADKAANTNVTSSARIQITNVQEAPIATGVRTDSSVWSPSMTANYTYSDPEGDAEGATQFQWTRNGSNIPGETGRTYTLNSADDDQTIAVKVTPVAATGLLTGTTVPANPRKVYNGDYIPKNDTGNAYGIVVFRNPNMNQAGANAYCAGLSTGGFTDWRVPTSVAQAHSALLAGVRNNANNVMYGSFPHGSVWIETGSTLADSDGYVSRGPVSVTNTNVADVICIR